MKSALPVILAISFAEDAHIPYVQRHIDAPFLLIDQRELLKGKDISYAFDGKRLFFVYNGVSYPAIQSVWYRKPPMLVGVKLPFAGPVRQYVYESVTNFMALVDDAFPDAFWLTSPAVLKKAENKIRQLQIAARLGFAVPRTLMTSSSGQARRFAVQFPEIIVKSVKTTFLRDKDTLSVMFSQKLRSAEMSFEGLPYAPSIFQEVVNARLDIRVTVVGKRVFAAAITGSAIDADTSTTRDWRVSNSKGTQVIEIFDLPKPIAELCRRFLQESGLQFGALDLVLDKKGKFWFLENNPNGQWAFVEEATGQPIGKAIAELLTRGK